MRMLRLLVPLLVLPMMTASAQGVEPPEGTRIASVHVSGFELRRLSATLQDEIGKLTGTPLDRRRLTDIAARIETEHPNHIAGVRASQDPEGGARVVFVVARLNDDQRAANINSRYVVEDVLVRGVPERDLDQALLGELRALAGRQLDSDEADRLEERLQQSLPEYAVSRRTVRGSQPGHVRLIFDARKADWARWLRFEEQDANLVYHSDQGWGARLPLSISHDDLLVSPTFAIDIGDDLIEEYGGFGLRIDSRRLGTERLGAFFEWSTYDQTWRAATVDALAGRPDVPALYRNRMTVTPVLKFAITRQLSLAGGVRVTELDPLSDSGKTRMANAAIAALSFAQRPRTSSGRRHDIAADFVLRAGTGALESDLTYERYFGQASYVYRDDRHTVVVSAMTGRIDGDAPLFERFAIGDSRTLRGWNKYDIAPLGGSRLFHASLEYRYHGVGLFVDTGAVWDAGADRKLRTSTGLTIHPGPVFFTVGFPLNTSEFGTVVTMGVRFSRLAVGFDKY